MNILHDRGKNGNFTPYCPTNDPTSVPRMKLCCLWQFFILQYSIVTYVLAGYIANYVAKNDLL